MPEALHALLKRGRGTMSGFTPGQRAVTVLGIIAILAGGFLFSRWAAKPTYTPLFSNLAASDASAIVEQLGSDGTPYQLADGGGTILVPQDKVYAERLAMSGKGLPAGSQDGYALLDKQGLTTSDFREQVDYQRALQGELAKTIGSITGVQSAVVHLALPEKDVFADESGAASASVLVSTRPGVTLTNGQVQAVVNLVSSSVPDLAPDRVSVADATGKVLTGSAGAGADGDLRNQQTQAYEDRISASVQEMLDQVVGPGHSVVRVSADLDFDKRDTKTETYVANPSAPPLAATKTTEKYSGGSGAASGVLGPDNVSVPSGTTSGNGKYLKTTESANNAVGKVVENRTGAPGTINRLTVAVVLDTRTAGNLNTAQVQSLVQNAVGFSKTRGDSVQVQRLPFDTTAAKAAKKELAQADAAEAKAGMMSMAKTGGLVLLVLAVLVLAFLSSRRGKRTELDGDEILALEAERRRLALEGSGVPAAIESTPRSALEITAPRASDGDSERRLVVREEIAELVERQPDEVAQLLRGWLADRRG
jgi:flagellar M-ring protein FliF